MPKDDPFLLKPFEQHQRQADTAFDYYKKIRGQFSGSANLFVNFMQFSRLPHSERMSYTGDGGAWEPDAESANKTPEHVKFVERQIIRDRKTRPEPIPKPGTMTRGVGESIRDVLAEIKDRDGPGAIKEETKVIPDVIIGPDNAPIRR